MLIESLFSICYNGFLICHRLRDIDSQNVLDLDLDIYNGTMLIVNIPTESAYAIIFVGNGNFCNYLSPFAR